MACDPVGKQEVAARLGVKPSTVHQWMFRGIMPPPVWEVNGLRAWPWDLILRWAGDTGHIQSEAAMESYRALTGTEPMIRARPKPKPKETAAQKRRRVLAATK